MAKDWTALTAGMSNVQRMVHLAARYDAYDVERIASELFRDRRQYYNAELTNQAARVGCPGRSGALGNGPILSSLKEQSVQDATSIANTFNYDLAIAITNIGVETPTANRHTYAAQLRTWEAARAEWKNPQIREYAKGTAISQAQVDFYRYNQSLLGSATLQPTRAVCPVCLGWIARGEVPLSVALSNPPPYHPNCPHGWSIRPEKAARSECPNIWMGA